MTTWIPVIVAVASALVAGWFAVRTKRVELRAQRLLELERRTAASRSEVFEPVIDAFGRIWEEIGNDKDLSPEWFEENVLPPFKKFMTWVQIYGSDDSVWVVHRYMQAIFPETPTPIAMRLLAELTLSARRELGHPETRVSALDIMGFRINDIYEGGVPLAWASLPERALYKNEGWTPPWGERFRFGRPLKP